MARGTLEQEKLLLESNPLDTPSTPPTCGCLSRDLSCCEGLHRGRVRAMPSMQAFAASGDKGRSGHEDGPWLLL